MPEWMPEKMPDRMSDRCQIECQNRCQEECQNRYQEMSDRMSEYMPERMSDRMSECMYICIHTIKCHKYFQMACQKTMSEYSVRGGDRKKTETTQRVRPATLVCPNCSSFSCRNLGARPWRKGENPITIGETVLFIDPYCMVNLLKSPNHPVLTPGCFRLGRDDYENCLFFPWMGWTNYFVVSPWNLLTINSWSSHPENDEMVVGPQKMAVLRLQSIISKLLDISYLYSAASWNIGLGDQVIFEWDTKRLKIDN